MAGLFNLGGNPDSPISRLLSPEVAMPIAGALLGGGGNMQNFGQALMMGGVALGEQKKVRAEQTKTNKSLEFLRKNAHPDYAAAVDAGVLTPKEAYEAFLADKKAEKLAAKERVPQYGLNPIYGQDESGNPVLGTVGTDGSFKKIDTGGVKIQTGVDKIDLGTQWGLINKRTGQIEGYMPKDIAGEAAQQEIGTAQGKAAASASGDLQAGENALALIDSIRKDPNKSWGVGMTSLGNRIPGTPGRDFQNKVDQAKSGAFLTAIQQMRGLGALSNAEGAAATAAVTRLDTATSEEEFDAALNDYETIVRQGMMRAQGRMGGAPQAQPTPGARLRYNPQTGELE